MPEVPAWLTVALAIVTGLVGNFLKPLFDFGARRAEAAVKAAEGVRDDMMRYAQEVRADNAVLRVQYRDMQGYFYKTANALIDFRTFVLSEGGKAQYHNDRNEREEVGKHLGELMDGAKRLQLPLVGDVSEPANS